MTGARLAATPSMLYIPVRGCSEFAAESWRDLEVSDE